MRVFLHRDIIYMNKTQYQYISEIFVILVVQKFINEVKKLYGDFAEVISVRLPNFQSDQDATFQHYLKSRNMSLNSALNIRSFRIRI